jgi:tripartite-type tricarboxylate transporter receptor subunit TctC
LLAEDLPTRPIRLVVVTVAGGLMDVAARVTADHVGKAICVAITTGAPPSGPIGLR